MRIILFVAVVFFCFSAPAFSNPRGAVGKAADGVKAEAGVDEMLGKVLPLDLYFYDESGGKVRLGEAVKGPTIVTFAYYGCRNLCPTVLGALSDVLGDIRMMPGRDFSVVTVSINEEDTPQVAAGKKREYIKASGRDLPDNAWRFLTGDPAEIKELTKSAGFRYIRRGEDFIHPASLIVVSGEGRITRYLYGNSYLPFDVEMALTEASKGIAAPAIRKAILFCFSYDPEGKRYVFNTLKVTGVLVIATVAVMFILINRKSGRDG